MKFGKKSEGAIRDSRERTADTLHNDLESVALAIECTNSDVTEDGIVPKSKCLQDTRERQLVTRSGLQRLRCCVCHLHHKQAMTTLATVRLFFKTVLQQVHHFKVDVMAAVVIAAAYKYYLRQEYQDLYNSSGAVMLREMQREVMTGRPRESRLHLDFSTNTHPSQLRPASELDCCFMAILPWRKPHRSRIMRKLGCKSRERTQGNEKRQN